MDLFTNPTDDQLALMGCGLALFVSAAMMYFSFYLGPMRNQQQSNSQESIQLGTDRTQKTQSESTRKAA